MASSSLNTRPHMSLFDVKNSMQLDMLDESRYQTDLWEVIKKLQAKKDGCKAEIQEIQKRGQTNLESLYVTYLQEMLDKMDNVIGMIYDAHFVLQGMLM